MQIQKGVYCLCLDADGAFLGIKTNYFVAVLIQQFAKCSQITPFSKEELQKFSQTSFQTKLKKKNSQIALANGSKLL